MIQVSHVDDLDRDRLRTLIAQQVTEQASGYVPRVIELWDELPSTNVYLTEQWAWRAHELVDGTVVVAGHQSAGLGRRNRNWVTPPGLALTVSTLVDLDDIAPESRTLLGAVAGLSVADCVGSQISDDVRLKWPNDVVVRVVGQPDLELWGTWRKLAGVLTGIVRDGARTAAIVGIGLNVHQSAAQLPVPHAVSVAQLTATHEQRLERTELAANVVARFLGYVDRLRQGKAHQILDEIAAASMMLGQYVQARMADGTTLEGRAIGLGESGQLVVQDGEGNHHLLLEGDVTRVRRTGSDNES